MMEDQRQWSWWAAEGEDPERYMINESSREAVISAARRDFGPSATFTIIEATQDGPFDCKLFDEDSVEDVIERFADANCERFGEDGFEGYICHTALADCLNAAIQKFIEENSDDIIVYCFTGRRNKEVFGPEGEDFAQSITLGETS